MLVQIIVMDMATVETIAVNVIQIGLDPNVNLLLKAIVMIESIMIMVMNLDGISSIRNDYQFLDGLIDCLDPDCCSSSRCQSTDECISRSTAKDMYDNTFDE